MLAFDLKKGIGKNGQLPWSLPNEVAYFNKMTGMRTAGKVPAVIMGRRTWDEVEPRFEDFIENRIVVVLSRKLTPSQPGVYICGSYDEALKLLSTKPLADQICRIWNIGGAEVCRVGMKHSTFRRLYLTKIDAMFDCDTFFPEDIDLETLREVEDLDVPQGIQEDNGIRYRMHVYENLQK